MNLSISSKTFIMVVSDTLCRTQNIMLTRLERHTVLSQLIRYQPHPLELDLGGPCNGGTLGLQHRRPAASPRRTARRASRQMGSSERYLDRHPRRDSLRMGPRRSGFHGSARFCDQYALRRRQRLQRMSNFQMDCLTREESEID